MLFVVCSLMMNMVIQGMEDIVIQDKLARSISRNDIFLWTGQDEQYHALTEQGDISESLMPNNDLKIPKIYKTQLIFKEDGKHFLEITQECSLYFTGYKYTNPKKDQSLLIPISISQEQYHSIYKELCFNKYIDEEAILTMDNEGDVYFITHIPDSFPQYLKIVGIGVISFAALCALLLYKHDQLVAFFNH
jgi:hypothetical protein